jgi:acetyltransferase
MHVVLVDVDSARKRYTTQHTLRNRVSVTFRPIECTDNARFKEFFKSLSPASVHYRFLEIIKELPDETVEKFCNLDYNQEIAIVAEPQGTDRIVAVARLIVESEKRQGEFALVVADAWHGLGLGAKLLDYIIKIAQDYMLEEIHCFVSSDNLKMIGLAEKSGFKVTSTDGDTLKMTLPLAKFENTPIA